MRSSRSIVNVLKGDLSLVGPRPPPPREVADCPSDLRRRLVVKPGLTGLRRVLAAVPCHPNSAMDPP
ncbi:sugar transferase [Micromonospora inositola]|uniref:sugar transferase n=1 Tax=Micromonospora inositola TaxID=47865 RepID=UPI000B5AE5F5|nr:sugar transferase [Micromonospora inositola]